MGGHGGLNILPQKSWNVYGRENRLKVARDEAKHEEEQRVKAEKQRLAESEARRAFLLRQAAIKRGDDPGEAQAQLPEQPASQGDDAPTGLLQHVNFFVEHEARELHPEVVEEARAEARRRGDAATQTSDARFDERFQLGYGLTGSNNQPWYAKRGPSLLAEEAGEQLPDHGQLLTLPGSNNTSKPGLAAAGAQPRLLTDGGKAREHRKEKKHSKEKRSKERGKDRKGEKEGVKKKGLDLERLREERRQRERVERERARQAIMADVAGRGSGGSGAYNAAYGNVAPSKKPAMRAS